MASTSAAQKSGRRMFDIITENLMKIGALTLEQFLDPSAQDSQLNNIPMLESSRADVMTDAGPHHPSTSIDEKSKEREQDLRRIALLLLHEACSQTFGSIDPIQYEYLEEPGQTDQEHSKKRCILTITRPNGSSRSYKTEPEFSRKAEAKAVAAALAIEMGAIEFIKNGAPDYVTSKKGLVLAPIDAPTDQESVERSKSPTEESEFVLQVEKACKEHRGGRIRSQWIVLEPSETNPAAKIGCALKVQISLHILQIYSVAQIYDDFASAKAACAKEAIERGVLDFVKHGNTRSTPMDPNGMDIDAETDDSTLITPAPMTLQGYFESLPRPFPESLDDKTAAEINAPSWLNMVVQSAKGAKIHLQFIWIKDAKAGLHGALLRLEQPSGCRSFLVDPQFPKRADAKAAVCLVAISQGIGDYVRALGKAIEDKIPAEMRKRATDSLMPLLSTEYGKIWPGKPPEIYEFPKERDAFGCNMTLKLKPEPQPDQIRAWSVPCEYRSKPDAKVAAVTLAFEQGAIEFLRFRGQPPPPGYVVDLPAPKRTDAAPPGKKNDKKRKSGESNTVFNSNFTELGPRKRQKMNDDAQSEASSAISRTHCSLPPKPHAVSALQKGALNSRPPTRAKSNHVVSRTTDRVPGSPQRGPESRQLPPGNTSGRGGLDELEPGELAPPPVYERAPADRYSRPDERHSMAGPADAYYDEYAPRLPFEHHHRPMDVDYAYAPVDLYDRAYAGGGDERHGYSELCGPPYEGHVYPEPAFQYRAHPDVGMSYSPEPYPPPHPGYPSSSSHMLVPARRGNRNSTPRARQPPAKATPAPSTGDAPREWKPGPGYVERQNKAGEQPQDRQRAASSASAECGEPKQQRQVVEDGQRATQKAASAEPGGHAAPGELPALVCPSAVVSSSVAGRPSGADGAGAGPSGQADKQTQQVKPGVSSQAGTSSAKFSKSLKAALIDYCTKKGPSQPVFHHSVEQAEDGTKTHKVWAILGTERLEHPSRFADLAEGEERLAKRILKRMQSQVKAGKA